MLEHDKPKVFPNHLCYTFKYQFVNRSWRGSKEGKYSLIVTDMWNFICGGDSGEPKVILTTNLSRC